jgi:hypothetical protein
LDITTSLEEEVVVVVLVERREELTAAAPESELGLLVDAATAAEVSGAEACEAEITDAWEGALPEMAITGAAAVAPRAESAVAAPRAPTP